MAEVSERIQRLVAQSFGDQAERILAELRAVPESLPLGDQQDPERLHLALMVLARGDLVRFEAALQLARTDWRDLLVAAHLAGADWSRHLKP